MKREMRKCGAIFAWIAILCVFHTSSAVNEPDLNAQPKGMFELYRLNREAGTLNYITEDFVVLAYSIFLNDTVTRVEKEKTMPLFGDLARGILEKLSKDEKPSLTEIKAIEYFLVINKLLSVKDSPDSVARKNGFSLSDESINLIKQEAELIEKAAGIVVSPILGQRIDYSQFRVRGKYTKTEELAAFFKAFQYASLPLFYLKESKATGITSQHADLLSGVAVLISKIIMSDLELQKKYIALESTLSFFSGPPDDLDARYYYSFTVKNKVEGISALRKKLFEQAKKEKRQPAIVSAIVDISALEQGITVSDVVTGWRLIPSRYSIDNAVFQKLVYSSVKKYLGKGTPFTSTIVAGENVKGFPLSDEFMQLLGSKTAAALLKKSGENDYEGYAIAFKEAAKELGKSKGLYALNIEILKTWLKKESGKKGDGSDSLQGAKAFWTYLKYINRLYHKQSYTVVGKGFTPPPPERKDAYLEPSDKLYVAILNAVTGLEGVFKDESSAAFKKCLESLIGIAQKEKAGKTLVLEDVGFLNNLDVTFKNILSEEDSPIVVDVHTDANSGKVLEEAVGFPKPAILKRQNATFLGARFTHFEFKYRMDERMTDEEWLGILSDKSKFDKLERYNPSIEK